MKSLYHQALDYLIRHNEIIINDNRLLLAYKYLDLNFFHPPKLGNVEVYLLDNLERQELEYGKDGLLRYLEIEPMDVVKSVLRIKLNVCLSINSDAKNYDLMIDQLSAVEREGVWNAVGSEKRKINLFFNIETHLVDFIFDCENNGFALKEHQKVIINV